MHRRIGIRREDKDAWEARVPLTPEDVGLLLRSCNTCVAVQPSSVRVFTDEAYASVGAIITEDISECEIVLAVKEIPASFFRPDCTYVFFSHTIKGQPYNMDMLRRMMELGCDLIDYERITDDDGGRLISFSRFAGIAGAVDTLWALGRRLEWEGVRPNPFAGLTQTHVYGSVDAALAAVAEAGRQVATEGVPEVLRPFVIGVSGYGRVSRGAQEVIDVLNPVTIEPEDLECLAERAGADGTVYKVVFDESHMVAPLDAGATFALEDYYRRPERYHADLARKLRYLSVLVNAVYWDASYPRLVTKADVAALWARSARPSLRVIGDITCDVGGSVEITVKETHVDQPVYVYEPQTDTAKDGFAGEGPVVLAVGNLPCELAREASEAFSRLLVTFLPDLVETDFAAPFEELVLPAELKRALILHRGELTPQYAYLGRFL